jgi:hypothetical protein
MSFRSFWVRWRAKFSSWLWHSHHPWDRWETYLNACTQMWAPMRDSQARPSCFFYLWLRVRHGTANCMWFVCRVDSCTSASYRKTWARNILFYFGMTGRIRLARFFWGLSSSDVDSSDACHLRDSTVSKCIKYAANMFRGHSPCHCGRHLASPSWLALWRCHTAAHTSCVLALVRIVEQTRFPQIQNGGFE